MINFVASANTTSTPAATMVVTLPSHSEGDVIILSFVHNYNSAVQALTAVSEGYTELASLAISGLGHQASIWYKKAGASEVNPTATYSASSQIMACLASSYSGVDATVQIDVGPSLWTTEDPGDTTVIAPSVTTTLDGAMLVNVATADDDDAFTQPSGMTLVDNLEFNSMTTASAYELIATAGATGDKTWTFAQNTDEITAVSFALRPAVGGGGISIVGDTALFDFNALAGTVELGGEILVTGSTASFDYAAISGTVDLTGQLLVTGDTANFDYTALPGGVDLTGEIIVTGSTANFDYTGGNGIVELGAVINVVGQTANFDFNGVNAEVSLTGEIIIIGDTATFNYQALSGLVVIGQGQKIGTVTAGFAESIIGVQYKQSTITVNFGE